MHIKLVAIVAIIAVLGLLASCMGGFTGEHRAEGLDVATMMTAQYRKISPQLAQEMIVATQPVTVVDVRTQAEYEQGHIPGAILVPNETISTTQKPDALPDLDATILVYCRSGNRSAQAARKLVTLGYVNVYDFGGIIDWPYDVVK